MVTARRRNWCIWVIGASAGAISLAAMSWPAPAQQRMAPSQLDALGEKFDEVVETVTNLTELSTKEQADLFESFLAWPRNPFEVVLTVRLTSDTDLAPVIGALTVKNGEVAVASERRSPCSSSPTCTVFRRGSTPFTSTSIPIVGQPRRVV